MIRATARFLVPVVGVIADQFGQSWRLLRDKAVRNGSTLSGFGGVRIHQMDGLTRHDRGYGVLINKLRVAITPQQHAKIIKPSHDALQLHPVDEKYRQRCFVLADMIEERVLQACLSFGWHVLFSVSTSGLIAGAKLHP
jgi:hypothetical protein